MFCKLNRGYSGSLVLPIKSWLNVLVKSRPNLSLNNDYDSETADVVRQFQSEKKAPLPDGIIDAVALHNIIRRIDPALVSQAARNNSFLRMILSNTPLVYDDEVHLSLTTVLALAAGFSFGDANTIAISNKATDYNAESNPMPLGKNNAAQKFDILSGANHKRLAGWHFVSAERLQELDQKWRNSREQVTARAKLGRFLHAFQDIFSHQGLDSYTGQYKTRVNENGKVERVWLSTNEEEWHQVDDPSRRPELAYEMAQQSYSKLVEALEFFRQKKWLDESFSTVGWNSISGEVKDFCTDASVQSRKEKLEKLTERLKRSQTNDSPRAGSGKAEL